MLKNWNKNTSAIDFRSFPQPPNPNEKPSASERDRCSRRLFQSTSGTETRLHPPQKLDTYEIVATMCFTARWRIRLKVEGTSTEIRPTRSLQPTTIGTGDCDWRARRHVGSRHRSHFPSCARTCSTIHWLGGRTAATTNLFPVPPSH